MALPPHLRAQILFDRAATAKYLGSILVLDAAGNVMIDAASDDAPRRGNFADRDYFTVQRDNPRAGLYISAPFQSRLRNGQPSIALSRRLSHADSSFAGIVLIAINLEYFHDLFTGLSLGHHGAISLIARNGLMIMRQPYDPKVIGRDISQASTFRQFVVEREGSFSDTSSIDGVRRLYFFRNFPQLPLIIMVAEAEPDIYAAWRRGALTIGSPMGAFALGFVTLSFILGTQLRRRMRAEAELKLLARTDSLTGLHNRRTLGEILEQEWRRARRTRSVFHCCSSISTASRLTTIPTATGPAMIRLPLWHDASVKTFGGRLTPRPATVARSSLSFCPIRLPMAHPPLPRRFGLRSVNSPSSTQPVNTDA